MGRQGTIGRAGVGRAALIAAAIGTLAAPGAAARSGLGAGQPGCALSGSESVSINGAGMLRLGDVAGCPGLRYEVIPGVMINGQPAVRLLPSDDCVVGAGAESVLVDGAPATRQGDAACAGAGAR